MANILEEVQHFVAAKLSADQSLSACQFLVENRKDIDYEIKNVLGRQGIVGVVMTPKATYAGKYEDLFLAWTLEELEIDIVENVIVNRGKKDGYITGQDAAMRLFDVLCPLSGDYEGQFNPVSYEEGEDSGLIVNKCVLKALIYGEHGDTPQPEPGLNMTFVKLLDGAPTKPPHDGWMWPTESGFVIWQNGQAHQLGVTESWVENYVESATSAVGTTDYLAYPNGTGSLNPPTPVEGFDNIMLTTTPFVQNSKILWDGEGNVWSPFKMEVVVDGQLSDTLQLELRPEYTVDGEGNLSYVSTTIANTPTFTVDGTEYKITWWIDGNARYHAVIGYSEHPEQDPVAEQGEDQDYAVCDLTFQSGSRAVEVRTTNELIKVLPAAQFIRDCMATDPGQEFYNLMSQAYLPLSGGTMTGVIQFSREAESELGYKLIQLNPTGEFWQMALGVDDYHGQPYVAHNGSETGSGESGQYTWKLWFPDENGTLATREWTSTQISDFVLTSQLPTKTSELSNDSGYITSAQVQPAANQVAYPAFAQNAVAAAQLNAYDTQALAMTDKASFNAYVTYNQNANTYDLVLKGQVVVPNNWYISKLFGETFSPALTLSWRRGTIYRKRVIGGTTRWSITYNNGWMWLLNGRYAMTASAEGVEDGKLYVLNYEDETHPNYINDPATDVHTLTFSFDNFTKLIATIDGQTEQAAGSRNTLNNILAFSDDLAYAHQLSGYLPLSSGSDFLPLSGGTLSGDLNVHGAAISVGDGYDSVEFHSNYMVVGEYHIDYPPREGTLATTQDIEEIAQYSFADGDLQAPAIELLNRTNTIVSAQQSVDVSLSFQSTGDGKMSDMWLNVYCPLSVTSPITINWPHSVVPKGGDYGNLSVRLSAWNTYMIVEKRPGTFMVAREVEELS